MWLFPEFHSFGFIPALCAYQPVQEKDHRTMKKGQTSFAFGINFASLDIYFQEDETQLHTMIYHQKFSTRSICPCTEGKI